MGPDTTEGRRYGVDLLNRGEANVAAWISAACEALDARPAAPTPCIQGGCLEAGDHAEHVYSEDAPTVADRFTCTCAGPGGMLGCLVHAVRRPITDRPQA